MGNSSSAIKVSEPPTWDAPWRSKKAKALDESCGYDRPPVPLGKSFSYQQVHGKKEKLLAMAQAFSLHTDKRALIKEAHQGGHNEEGATSGSKADGRSKNAAPQGKVPAWRKRIHAARRRATLQVGILVHIRRRAAPKRLDDLSFCIPVILREQTTKFLKHQADLINLVNEVETYRDALELPPTALTVQSSPNTRISSPITPPAAKPSGAANSSKNLFVQRTSLPTIAGREKEGSNYTLILPPAKTDALIDHFVSGSKASNAMNGHAVGGRKAIRMSDNTLPPLVQSPTLLNRMTTLLTRGTRHSSPNAPRKQLPPMSSPTSPLPHPPDSSPSKTSRPSRISVPGSPSKPGWDGSGKPVSNGQDMASPGSNSMAEVHAVLKKVQELPAVPRKKELQRLMHSAQSKMQSCDGHLQDVVHSCNNEWAEKRQWKAAPVEDGPTMPSWLESDVFTLYSAQVVQKLKMGQIAVQLHANEDSIRMPNGELQDLWTADPWLLCAMVNPASVPVKQTNTASSPSSGMDGLDLGTRIIRRMVDSLESLVGSDGVSKLTILLHISEQQVFQLQADVWAHPELYRRVMDRLLIIVHNHQPGYSFNQSEGIFKQDLASSPESLGTGYSMMQLSWPGEASTLTFDDGDARLAPVPQSAMDVLNRRGVEWIVSWRARDLGLLHSDSVFNIPMLSYMLKENSSSKKAKVCIEVCQTPRGDLIERHNSVILGKVPRTLQGSNTKVAPSSIYAAELRASELHSEVMKKALKTARTESHNLSVLGMSRYMLHVPTLEAMLGSYATFRPRLTSSKEGLLRVSMDIADITANFRAQSVALQTRQAKGVMTVQDGADIEELARALREQDKALADHAASISAAQHAAPSLAGATIQTHAMARRSRMRRHTFLALLNLENTQLCDASIDSLLQLVRPEFDKVILMSIVVGEPSVASAKLALEVLAEPLKELQVHVEISTPIKCPVSRLVDCLENEVVRADASIVITGSKTLVSNYDSYLDSISLNLLRRLQLPMIFVTNLDSESKAARRRLSTITSGPMPASKAASPQPKVPNGQKSNGIRCLAVLDQASRPLVHFVCSLLDPVKRNDRLTLGQKSLPAGQMTPALASSMRSMLSNFLDITTQHDIVGAVGMTMEGELVRAVVSTVTADKVQLVALQLPRGAFRTILPRPMLNLVRVCPVPILIFPETSKHRNRT